MLDYMVDLSNNIEDFIDVNWFMDIYGGQIWELLRFCFQQNMGIDLESNGMKRATSL